MMENSSIKNWTPSERKVESPTTEPHPLKHRHHILPRSIFWCAILFCAWVNQACASQYQVQGTLKVTDYTIDGTAQPERLSNFTFQRSDKVWEIVIRPAVRPKDFSRVSFDGTNLYCLQNMEGTLAANRRLGMQVGENQATGHVIVKEVPNDRFSDGAGQVWLAYGSEDYFRGRKPGAVEVPFFQVSRGFSDISDSIMREAVWVLSESSPQLPSLVTYHGREGFGAFTNAEYLVSDYTNIAGLKLPSKATFLIYHFLQPVGGERKQRRWVRYELEAERFQIAENTLSFPPAVAGLTFVMDYRFGSSSNMANAALYKTDKRFLSQQEILALPADKKKGVGFMRGSRVQQAHERTSTTRMRWIVVGFMVSGLAILLFAVRKRPS